jgi:serine/threonine-protein kinase HipA
MTHAAELDVRLHDEHVATVRGGAPGHVTLQYERLVLDRYARDIPLLSCSLPLQERRLDALAFVNGLLPEGRRRLEAARVAGVPTHDVVGLLARLGGDLPGAVTIDLPAVPERLPDLTPYSDERLAETVAALADRPLGRDEDAAFSLAGLRDKLALVALPDGRWGQPRHGHPSTHVLKLGDPTRPGRLRAEHACLRLAAAAGVPAVGSRLLVVGGVECLLVTRFDRHDPGHRRPIARIHQEDVCQALGIDPESNHHRARYEWHGGPTLARIAALLGAWAADPECEQLALLDRVVLTVAIGDAEAHGRNIALLHPEPDTVALAPVYSPAPAALWPHLQQRAALSIGTREDLLEVTVADLVREAGGWGLGRRTARTRIYDLLQRLAALLDQGAVDVDSRALAVTQRRVEDLLF